MNLQVQQNMNDQTTSNTNGVTKSPMASSGSQGAVAQLDDTGRGMSGNIRHPEGCLWKNKQITVLTLIYTFMDGQRPNFETSEQARRRKNQDLKFELTEQVSCCNFSRNSQRRLLLQCGVLQGISGQFSSIQHYSATQYNQRTNLSTETVLTLIYTFMDGQRPNFEMSERARRRTNQDLKFHTVYLNNRLEQRNCIDFNLHLHGWIATEF